jgi:hypothetical protein
VTSKLTHYADKPATGHECFVAVTPDFFKLGEELFIVADGSQLTIRFPVLLQCPVRRGRDHQMYAVWFNTGQHPGILECQTVMCGERPKASFYGSYHFRIFGNSRKVFLRVGKIPKTSRHKVRKVKNRGRRARGHFSGCSPTISSTLPGSTSNVESTCVQ